MKKHFKQVFLFIVFIIGALACSIGLNAIIDYLVG